MVNSTFPPWKETYQKALRESNNEKQHELVLAAEEAIFRRFQELQESANHGVERTEMEAAAADLLAIKTHKLGWPSVK